MFLGEKMASTPWREGIEAIVFRTVNDQPTLWDSILPPELLVLPVELGRVDALHSTKHDGLESFSPRVRGHHPSSATPTRLDTPRLF